MPTYDYQCTACGHRFEQFQSMKDKPLTKCPACGKKTLERLIGTGGAIIFKGSGFYQTDYRSESYKKAAKAESGAAESSSTSSTDAAKSPPKTEPTPAPAPAAEKPKKPAKPKRE